MRKVKQWLYWLALLSIPLSNVQADAEKTTTSLIENILGNPDVCQASYDENGVLNVPCVLVTTGNETVSYHAILKRVSENNPQFALESATQNEFIIESPCTSYYNLDSGKLDIACISGNNKPLTLVAAIVNDTLLFTTLDSSTRSVREVKFLDNPPHAKTKVVLVDGLDPERVAQCYCGYNTACQYVYIQQCQFNSYTSSYVSIELKEKLKKIGIREDDILAFLWDRNAVWGDGKQLSAEFKSWISEKVCQGTEDCNLILIAHSWGSVIVADFIANLPDISKIIPTLLITAGNPIEMVKRVNGNNESLDDDNLSQLVIDKFTYINEKEGKKLRWYNLINLLDPIAWPIPNDNTSIVNNINARLAPSVSNRSNYEGDKLSVFGALLDFQNELFNHPLMNIIDVWGTGKTADLFNDSVNALTGISIDLWGNEFRFPDSHEFSNYNPDYIVELVSNYMSKEYGFIKDSMKLFDLIEVNSPSHSKNYTSYKLSLGKAGTSLSNKILPDDYTICAPTSVSGQYRCVRIYGEEDSPSRGHVALVTTYQDDGQDFSRWSSGLLKPHGRLKDAINKYSNPQ